MTSWGMRLIIGAPSTQHHGKTGNAAERALVNKLVTDIHSARRINNRMTIE